jgi:hypothetical protein
MGKSPPPVHETKRKHDSVTASSDSLDGSDDNNESDSKKASSMDGDTSNNASQRLEEKRAYSK